ncbi:L-lactate MFS transporter [Fusibacter sp. JL216-2]|uniref:L-lactate MFS transporter n=1 Tax=Fusibacter sp. JL216-2 TaxID=3071453 RepID=UPI003D34CBAF
MIKQKSVNRWSVVFGAVLLQVCLGAIYSWSLFNQPLMDKYGWTNEQVVMTYSIAIFVFAFSTIFSGRLQDKIGPRKVATIGGILYGGGLILASFSKSLPGLYFFYGVLGGAGVGFAYVCPLSTCLKWFPEKKGFITGIAVGAFGGGSLVFKSLIQHFLEAVGVSHTFLYLGSIYLLLVVIGAQFLKVPDRLDAQKASTLTSSVDFTVGEMIRQKSFYFIWIMFMLGCMPGLLVIGLAKDIGIEVVGLDPATAANAVALIALFNAGGRLAWGTISDRIGRIEVVLIMFIVTAVSLVTMAVFPRNALLFFICLAGIACSFGGFLALFPTITGEGFGMKNIGANYGVVYQAYGIAAIIGPILKRHSSGFTQTFIMAACFAVTGAILALVVKSMRKREQALVATKS